MKFSVLKTFIVTLFIASIQINALLSKEPGQFFQFRMSSTDRVITEIGIPLPTNFTKSQNLSNNEIFDKEFIPFDETFDAWNEIITILQTYRPTPYGQEFADNMKKTFLDKGAVIEDVSFTQQEHEVQFNTFIIDTPSMNVTQGATTNTVWNQKIKNKNELIASKVVSGPFSIVTIQYSIRYDINKTSLEQKKALKEKQLSFLQSCSLSTKDKKLNYPKNKVEATASGQSATKPSTPR